MKPYSKFLKALLIVSAFFVSAQAQTDTLKLMTYNVLYYGDSPPCQAPHDVLHGYLKTIVSYTKPDIFGLIKLAAPKQDGDPYATAPMGWPDSILKYAMNAAYADRYAYAPYSNDAKANNIELLVYNRQKLGYAGKVCSYSNIIDFNTYKLFYKDPNLSRTHDTTFLYVTLNHDKSGDESVKVRAGQIKGEMSSIQQHFTHLANHINMGDFNVRGSDEPFYQTLCFPADTAFQFFDPPFYEHKLKYPANWDHDPVYAAYFTTSTRQGEFPNGCGTGGGAKNWYDHIFMSSWIMHNANYISYIPNSYRTIGNSGNRYKIAINNPNPANTSVPADVLEALFRFSNKYPVMADLLVTANTTGNSPKDPEIPGTATHSVSTVSIDQPVTDVVTVHFSEDMMDQAMTIVYKDMQGNELKTKSFKVKNTTMTFPFKQDAGTYHIVLSTVHSVAADIVATKK